MRSAVHLTGRPSRRAATRSSGYSGYTPPRAPKPPPVSGTTTRRRSGSIPIMWTSTARMPWADWHPTRSVQRDAAGSYSATADRGSMKTGAIRLLMTSTRVTCAARANAASTARRSPPSHSNDTLLGRSSQTRGASGPSACSMPIAAARGS